MRVFFQVTPAPSPTERDRAVIVGGGYWAFRLYPVQERRAYFWEEVGRGRKDQAAIVWSVCQVCKSSFQAVADEVMRVQPEDPMKPVGPMDGLATPGIPEYPVHLLGNLVNLQMLSVRNNEISELPGRSCRRGANSGRVFVYVRSDRDHENVCERTAWRVQANAFQGGKPRFGSCTSTAIGSLTFRLRCTLSTALSPSRR